MKRKLIKAVAVILAVLMPVLTASVALAQDVEPNSSDSGLNSDSGLSTKAKVSKYDKLDINELTGHGKEPEDISVSAGATYQEKAWYEYVTYSDHAVSSYRLNDDSRILFYDPYTYSNAMVMDVDFDPNTTSFDTMSSYSVSHTNSKSIEAAVSSTDTHTSATQTSGLDLTGSNVETKGKSKTTYNHRVENTTSGKVTEKDTYHYKNENYDTSSYMWNLKEESATGIETSTDGRLQMLGVKVDLSETLTIGSSQNWTTNHNTAILQDYVEHETKYSPDYKTTTSTLGNDEIENESSSSTEGWTQLSARVTKTIGSSVSTTNSWSETESTTISKTYAATHFASDGVTPLPWAIVHYKVQMPMKTCLQVKYSGEWVTISTVYCLLTTVQGTCRAWMQNGQTYYEDWGNGEPVVETEFWSKFMTVDRLIKAYENKLYPVGGEE